MAAIAFLSPAMQFLDDNGDPLAGGFVYTYEAGTVTPTDTWFNSDLDPIHANSNPIELDSAGRCVIYVDTTPSLKIIVKDADLVTVLTQDNISPAALAS